MRFGGTLIFFLGLLLPHLKSIYMKSFFSMLALAGVVAVVFTCCNNNSKSLQPSGTTQSTATATNNLPVSSSAAVASDTALKFVRTADIKFRVSDVAKATYAIEDIVTAGGGFITYTNLQSNVVDNSMVPVSTDSSLQITHYDVTNSITLRVPNVTLDSTLKAIAQQVEYLDYRLIRADDVALQLLDNKLKQQRLARHEKRLSDAIDNTGKKLPQVADAEDLLLNRQQQADNALLANLNTQNKIDYSTVTLQVYQRTAGSQHVIANYKNISAYQPALLTRLKDAAADGWQVMAGILVFIVQVWWLIVLLLGVWLAYKRLLPRLA